MPKLVPLQVVMLPSIFSTEEIKMEFIHSDLGFVSSGTNVRFDLSGNQANVKLIDDINFNYYKTGMKYHYVGGLAQKTIVTLTVPNSGHWHAVVDMNGVGGKVRASISVV